MRGLIPLSKNLQLFAEPAANPEGENGGHDGGQGEGDAENTVDYAALLNGINIEDVQKAGGMLKYIQSQADARATKAINTARANWEREQTEAQTEAARLAKMTEAEKEKYQFEQDKKKFEEERAKFAHDQLVLETAKQMTAAGLPDLSAFVTGKDADATKDNLGVVTDVLSQWKQEQLNSVMRGTPPKDIEPGKTLTKDDINKMTPEEINKAWADGLIDTASLK